MTTLGATQADSLLPSLRRMGLEPAPAGFRLSILAGGISSLIARADTRSGPVCIKRALPRLAVQAEWRAPVERNRAEVAWMRCAGGIIPSAVPPVLGEDPQAHTFAMTYLDPATHPVWKTLLRDGAAGVSTARAVGEDLAAIHAATANREDLARAFANDSSFHALRVEPYLLTTARVHPDCAAALNRLAADVARIKRSLMHGDVSPKNILVGPHGPVFLDAECACYGDPAFDVAFCLTHLLLKCIWRPGFRALYLGSFQALTASYLRAVRWEPPAELERRACGLLAGLLLARVDGKSPAEYLVDEDERAEVRRFAKNLLNRPLARLHAIGKSWADHLSGSAPSGARPV